MQLYLLRHADAVENAVSDAARELTAKGVEQARRVGTFGRQHGLVPELILSSPHRRAEQTARIFAEDIGGSVTRAEWLASGMKAETALAELEGYTKLRSVMLVGHEPDFSRLAAALLGLPLSAQICLRKGSLTLFTLENMRPGAARLDFTLPPELL